MFLRFINLVDVTECQCHCVLAVGVRVVFVCESDIILSVILCLFFLPDCDLYENFVCVVFVLIFVYVVMLSERKNRTEFFFNLNFASVPLCLRVTDRVNVFFYQPQGNFLM